jgi:peptidoglycan/LPS O-acetylase OafA/YrhL
MTAALYVLPDMQTPQGAGRLVALDGLRGLAVICVLFEHFTYSEWVRSFSPGAVGVKTFFVLSGFLITGILIDLRSKYPPAKAATLFFTRRLRRLLPAFAIAILLAAALGLAEVDRDWIWHVSYLSNVQVWWQERWSGAGHFWTLALEQQFYILWFPVVVVLPQRWLFGLLLALICFAPIFRAGILFGASPFIDVLLPAQADALAAGGMLALVSRGDARLQWLSMLTRPRVLASITVFLFAMLSMSAWGFSRPDWLSWVVVPSVIVLAATAIIATLVNEPERLALLRLPALTWLGTISYGLYIYHYFVPQFFAAYLPIVAEAETPLQKVVRLAAWLALSLALAQASWLLVERRFLRRPVAR